MKVLFINVDSGFGGSTGRIVNDLYSEVVNSGGEALVLYGREFNPYAGVNAVRIGSDLGVYTHALLSRITDRTAFFSKRATVKAIREIEKFNPDIIHLHNLHGYYINIKILFDYLKTCGKPVVWTLHDCWAYTGHCTYYDMAKCYKWLTGCSECPQMKEYPTSILMDASARNYRNKKDIFHGVANMRLVTPSLWLKKEMERSFLKEYTVSTIYNGINLDIFKPTESKLREEYGLGDKFVILGVAGIWAKRKGFDDFMKLSRLIDGDCHIVLIGIDDEKIKNLPANCIGIRRTRNPQELATWYSTANVFLNLTYEDNYPTTNLEAISCGTPVITYSTGGSPESVDDKCGRVVSVGDVDGVVKALMSCVECDTDYCIRKAREQFTKAKCFREYTALYNELLSHSEPNK